MKRKKLTALLLCIALTVSIFSNLSFSVAAIEINSLENYLTFEEVYSGGGLELLYYRITDCDTSVSGEITVRSQYNGYPVTDIGDSAFAGCKQITSVIISEGIETIGARAFQGCTSLEKVFIPKTLKTTLSTPFAGCTSLKGIYISDLPAWCNVNFSTRQGNPLLLAGNLYLNDELVENLVFTESITDIPYVAFFGCTSLKSVTFSDKTEHIGESAFYGCSNLSEINIPDAPIHIEKTAFGNTAYYANKENWENENLYIDNHLIIGKDTEKEYTVKDGTVTVADYAFDGNLLTVETLNLPDSLQRIGDYSFFGSLNLTTVNFGTGLKHIGKYAFANSIMMDEVVLNEGLEFIDDYAFYDSALQTLHFPSTLVTFNPLAFFCTTDIYQLTCAENNPEFVAENNALFTKDKSTLLMAANYFPNVVTFVVPQETTEIAPYAFALSPLVSISLHDNIKKIGEGAFDGTKYDTSDTDVTCYIGNYLLYSRAGNLVLKEGTVGMVENAMLRVNVLSLTVPESMKFIDSTLFGIGSISVPSLEDWFEIEIINEDGLINLEHVNILVNGEDIESIEIPESMTELKRSFLGDCCNLKSVTIPSTVKSIDVNAFPGRKNNLTICCLEGSVAHTFAVENNIKHILFDVFAKGNTTVDYTNKIIKTSINNANDISDIIDISESKTAFALGSQYASGKHIWGTGSTITLYEGEERVDYVLIVDGDTNGDGICNILDVAEVERASNNNLTLNEYAALAADSNYDNQVSVEDYSYILNCALSA